MSQEIHATRWQQRRAPGVIISTRQVYRMGDDTHYPLLEEQIVLESPRLELERK
jgi:hypothetical protein